VEIKENGPIVCQTMISENMGKIILYQEQTNVVLMTGALYFFCYDLAYFTIGLKCHSFCKNNKFMGVFIGLHILMMGI